MITKMSHDWEAAVVTIRYDNATLTGADEAKAFAFLRAAVDTQHAKAGGSFELRVQWILEPKPRTLRDEARAVVPEQWQADAVLAAVKARLDALPRSSWEGFPTYIHVNDIDALFRGTS